MRLHGYAGSPEPSLVTYVISTIIAGAGSFDDRHVGLLQNRLYVHDLSSGNKLSQLPLEVGTIVGYSGKKKDSEVGSFIYFI